MHLLQAQASGGIFLPSGELTTVPLISGKKVTRTDAILTSWMRGSKRSSWGAPCFLKLPDSLNTESEAAFTAVLSTLEAGSCAVFALSSRRRSAEYSPACTQGFQRVNCVAVSHCAVLLCVLS